MGPHLVFIQLHKIMGVCLSVIRVEAKLPREQGGVRRGERSVEERGSRHGNRKVLQIQGILV